MSGKLKVTPCVSFTPAREIGDVPVFCSSRYSKSLSTYSLRGEGSAGWYMISVTRSGRVRAAAGAVGGVRDLRRARRQVGGGEGDVGRVGGRRVEQAVERAAVGGAALRHVRAL